MTQNIIDFLYTCPALKAFDIRAGFLEKKPMSASLSPLPETEILRTYTDGDCMMKSTYTLMLRLPYSPAGAQDAEKVLSEIADFIYSSNQTNCFPELPHGNFAASLGILIPDSPKSHTANSCVFSVKLYMTHYSIHKKGLIIC